MNIRSRDKCVFGTADNGYVQFSAIALLAFIEHNDDHDAYILSSFISNENKILLDSLGIQYIEFSALGFEGFGSSNYPKECFYHFYAPEIFINMGYKYSCFIDGDILSRKKISKKLYLKIQNYHIAGSSYGNLIHFIDSVFPENIASYFIKNSKSLNTYRINTGVLFYNNIKYINDGIFNELLSVIKILNSFGHIPKGDDSLFSLLSSYSSLLRILPLEKNFNNNKFENSTYLELIEENIFHLHRYKPWHDEEYSGYPINAKLLANEWLNVMLDYFPEKYIKKYFPCKFKNIQTVYGVPLTWYQGRRKNFGDSLTRYLGSKLAPATLSSPDESLLTKPHILGVGSILRLSNSNSIIWGSGVRNFNQTVNSPLHIFSCRGIYSLASLLEAGYSPSSLVRLGDPGLILPSVFSPKVLKDKNLAVIPHITQYKEISMIYCGIKDVTVIDLETDDVEDVISEILRHRYVVSSSLHGLIVADAYDIPSIWLKYKDTIVGDYSKFYDHYSSLGIGRDRVNFISLDPNAPFSANQIICEIAKKNFSRNMPSVNSLSIFRHGEIRRHLKHLILNEGV